jgi:hypothetical protein
MPFEIDPELARPNRSVSEREAEARVPARFIDLDQDTYSLWLGTDARAGRNSGSGASLIAC